MLEIRNVLVAFASPSQHTRDVPTVVPRPGVTLCNLQVRTEDVHMPHSDFRGATFFETHFIQTHVEYSTFTGMNLQGVAFRQLHAHGADFRNASLVGATLDFSDL